jgi:hypothetical protein
MRTEGFRKQIGKLAVLMGILTICTPAFAQHVSALLPASESGGIQPVSFHAEPQNSQSFSSIRIPPIELQKQNRFVQVEQPSRKSWLALSAVVSGAEAFDAYSTRVAVSHGAVEDDPLMRPFAHSPAIYAVGQISPLVLDIVARHMQRSNNSFVRRMWWIPQSVASAEFIYCGAHNLRLAGQP